MKYIYKQTNAVTNCTMFYGSRKKAVEMLIVSLKSYGMNMNFKTSKTEWFTEITGINANGHIMTGNVEKVILH